MKLNPYLNFGGNCRQAFEYYEKHLGGKTTFVMTHAQMPDATNIPPERANDILHASMSIGGATLMASDVPDAKNEPMRSAYLSLSCTSTPEAETAYKALADGGQVFMPIQETFWAHRFGIVRDKFGINWMVNHDKPMQ